MSTVATPGQELEVEAVTVMGLLATAPEEMNSSPVEELITEAGTADQVMPTVL